MLRALGTFHAIGKRIVTSLVVLGGLILDVAGVIVALLATDWSRWIATVGLAVLVGALLLSLYQAERERQQLSDRLMESHRELEHARRELISGGAANARRRDIRDALAALVQRGKRSLSSADLHGIAAKMPGPRGTMGIKSGATMLSRC
jgi:hypothetical protein